MIDLVELRTSIKTGKLKVFISGTTIYIKDTENGDTVKLGGIEVIG